MPQKCRQIPPNAYSIVCKTLFFRCSLAKNVFLFVATKRKIEVQKFDNQLLVGCTRWVAKFILKTFGKMRHILESNLPGNF